MSKTYLDQVNKAKALVKGLRENYEEVKRLGISQEELSKLEDAISEGEGQNSEVERLKAETSQAIGKANQTLVGIKDSATALKRIVKQNYDISRWADFGIPDKR